MLGFHASTAIIGEEDVPCAVQRKPEGVAAGRPSSEGRLTLFLPFSSRGNDERE